MPGSCHQCNAVFSRNLKLLEDKNLEYSFLLSEDYSEDLEYIKKEYNLTEYKIKRYIFSTDLFDAYYAYEQSYVLQYGIDSSFKIFNNATALIQDYESLNFAEIIKLDNYSIKKSTSNITVNGKEQICVQNSVRKSTFDYIDLRNQKKNLSISFNEKQLLHHYILFFKDTVIAKQKLNEVNKFDNIPQKDVFDRAIFNNDSLLIFSQHTYIQNLKDSILSGFMIMNLYKEGKYLESRPISYKNVPTGYYVIEHFHIFNNKLYIKLVKDSFEIDKPNYFVGMFELENGIYEFKKILNFTVPDIHNDVQYTFLELRFSGKYFMTSISNILFNLETEEIEYLNIPTNNKIEYTDLINNFIGTEIVISSINILYPNLLLTYFTKDAKGEGTNVVLNYNLKNKKIIGKIKMPIDNSRFIKPDESNFGYYLWTPKKSINDFLIYRKLF